MAKPEDRLARLLDDPSRLARLVPHLPAESLHRLIRYRGLDASGDILAAATREQLSSLLDVDLWQGAPAADEGFDADRFGEWLEALLENGEDLASGVVSAIDERLVTAGLSAHIRVFDPAVRAGAFGDDDAVAVDLSPRRELEARVGGYEIVARRADAWDAIVTLLVSLEAGHPKYFHAVMRGCRRLSNSAPEADGFHDLMAERGQLRYDLGVDRDDRRRERGYLTPADARMVLAVARRQNSEDEGGDAAASLSFVAARYLETKDETAASEVSGRDAADANGRASRHTALTGANDGSPRAPESELQRSIDTVVELLAEVSGVEPGRPRGLLGAPDPAHQPSQLQALLAYLADGDQPRYEARSRELAFIANALVAGCSFQARSFTPQEASDAALAACALGLEEWQERHDAPSLPETFLAEHDLLSIFQLGWAALYEMSMWAAGRLLAVLADLRSVDVETQLGLHMLARDLGRHRDAGTPWRARDALDVIATLDMLAWVSLLGVLDECPILPAALRATIERRTGAVSATDFEFISSRAQIADVQAFMARLLHILVG